MGPAYDWRSNFSNFTFGFKWPAGWFLWVEKAYETCSRVFPNPKTKKQLVKYAPLQQNKSESYPIVVFDGAKGVDASPLSTRIPNN